MSINKRINKCCLDKNNTVTVIKGWSHLCGICGRYTYDYVGNQVTKPYSILTLGKERYFKFLKLAKEKVEKNKS